MDEQKKQNTEEDSPPTFVFSIMIMTNVLINLDHGILPACTTQMQKQFGMNQFELGVLGSMVYLGISIMGLLAGRLYQIFNSKNLTVIALILLEIALGLFVLSQHKATAYISRFLTGACQVFLIVYYPIWIDKFGKDKKTMWLTLLQICVPIGIFTGYGITAIVLATGHQYQLSFYIQIVIVAVFIALFLLFPKKKLDSRRKIDEDSNDANVNVESLSISSRDQQQQNPKYNVSYMLCHLMKSKMYLVGAFSMAVILYVSTGIQFWLTKYFIDVLGYEAKSVFIAYVIVTVTGPTSGAGFGGYILNNIGGYDHPQAIYYVFVFSAIGIGSAIIIPFVEGLGLLCTLLWIVLFFGGAMMPGLTGITMTSVSPYLRAFGNSTSQIVKNVFGYLPSPFVYGMLNTYFGNRAGIKFLMFWGLWAPILCGYGCWHKYHQLKKLKESEKGNSVFHEEEVYSDLEGQQNREDEPQNPIKRQGKQLIETKDKPELAYTAKHS